MKSHQLTMMSHFVILSALLFALKEVEGQTNIVSKCLLRNGTLPMNAYVEGCLEPPCILHQLEYVVINVTFKAPYKLDIMTTKALTMIKTLPIPIPLIIDLQEKAVTCNFLTNATCPVMMDEVVQYTLRMYVGPRIPIGISLSIEFRVEDKNNLPVWCISLPFETAGPRKQAGINRHTQIGDV